MSGQALAFMLIMWGSILTSATVCLRAVLKNS